jgi:arginyl-tRNA synthetase
LPTDATRQEEEEEVEEEEKEAFQRLQRGRELGRHGCFQQSMMGDIQELHALGISTDEKNTGKNITFGSLEGSRLTKRWIWALFNNERGKGEKVFVHL